METKYKELIVENYVNENISEADTIELAVFDMKTGEQKYVDMPITLSEELAVERIYNDIVKQKIDNGEFEHNGLRYEWKISVYN